MAMAAQTTLTDLEQLLPSAPIKTGNQTGSHIPGSTGEIQQSLFPPWPSPDFNQHAQVAAAVHPVLGLRLQLQIPLYPRGNAFKTRSRELRFSCQGWGMSSGSVRNACTSTQQLEKQLQLLQPVLAAQFWRFSANRLCQSFPKVTWIPEKQRITNDPILISKWGKPNWGAGSCQKVKPSSGWNKPPHFPAF